MIRLFVQDALYAGASVALSPAHLQHLRAVMGLTAGTALTLFNGKDGAWQGSLQSVTKKSAAVVLDQCISPQIKATLDHVTLFFSPLKTHRQAMLIEKAVELGVGHLQPIIMARTQGRHFRLEKAVIQCAEAAAQCERLSLPTLGEPCSLEKALNTYPMPVICGAERLENQVGHPQAKGISDYPRSMHSKPLYSKLQYFEPNFEPMGLLVGPEGGFTIPEMTWIQSQDQVTCVSFGREILRAETAAIFGLSWIKSHLVGLSFDHTG